MWHRWEHACPQGSTLAHTAAHVGSGSKHDARGGKCNASTSEKLILVQGQVLHRRDRTHGAQSKASESAAGERTSRGQAESCSRRSRQGGTPQCTDETHSQAKRHKFPCKSTCQEAQHEGQVVGAACQARVNPPHFQLTASTRRQQAGCQLHPAKHNNARHSANDKSKADN